MDYFKVLDEIKKDQISPVMLLYGTESYFIHQIKKQLQQQVLQNETENLSTYDLSETPIQEVMTDVETYPFFGEKKLIFATNPTFLQTRSPKLPFEHQIDRLETYLSSPVDYSILVFVAPYDRIDQRKKITRLLKNKAITVHCKSIRDNELQKWIKELAHYYNITIERAALDYLQSELTVNLQLLENEIQKLALYVGQNGVITREIAEKLISSTVDGSALSLVDAVMERSYEKAFSIYRELSIMNEEPIALIALLAYQFRMILQVKLMKEKGYNQSQMQRQLGGHPYVIKIASDRERRFTFDRLADIMHNLTKTDAEIKFGKTEKNLAFELLLYDLIAK